MAEQNDERDWKERVTPPPHRRGGQEPSGSVFVDKVNEGVRKVLGDAEVDYGARAGHTPVDEELIQERAEAHGDVVTRNPDGSHTVTSVAPSPADPHTPADATESQPWLDKDDAASEGGGEGSGTGPQARREVGRKETGPGHEED